jgi:hypothetical protein
MRWRVLFFLIGLGSWACTDSGSPVDFGDRSGPIFPLKLGNKWAYRISYYDTLGAKFQVSYDTMTILTRTMVENQEWYLWRDPDAYLSDQPGGTWYRNIRTDTMSQAGLFYKYPASVGESWATPYMMYSTLTLTLTSANSVVEVPAGRFGCYVYQIERTQNVEFLVPGIGLVYSELYPGVPSGKHYKYVRELTSYSVN